MATKKISKKQAKQLVEDRNRQVEKDNKAFQKLSPSGKRMAIARDVLAQMELKRLVPTVGLWLDIPGGGFLTEDLADKNPELKDVLNKTKKCEGCALGGMFMCAVKRADELKMEELEDINSYNEEVAAIATAGDDPGTVTLMDDAGITDDDTINYLSRFFSEEQLEMIEAAFERNEGAFEHRIAGSFCFDVEEPAERMRLIMENIIVNKGKFVPTKGYVIRYETPGFTG